ncbi:hypothetical protein ACFWIX_05285 [Pseudarthrobacter sp. NPDC058362]|uniref:hypothetical protein n=1 Tax=Pseudarthrobacter sp. NPDC058362 TaxID=3346458 RepID=UPI00364D24F4
MYDRPRAGVPRATPESRSAGMVEVRVRDKAQLQQALADAVRTVGDAAERYGTGIMITDVGDGCYVVRAHPAVPYGLVREQPGMA